MTKPTKQRLLEYIEAYIDAHSDGTTSRAPTIREMAAGASISSTSVVHYHLKALEKLGMIEREGQTIRGVRIGSKHQEGWLRAMGGRAKHTLDEVRPGVTGCMLCGAEDVPLELDHFYPLAKGGVDADHNWILLCQDCNRKKSDREPVSFVLDNYGLQELKAIIEFLLTEESNEK